MALNKDILQRVHFEDYVGPFMRDDGQVELDVSDVAIVVVVKPPRKRLFKNV